MRACHTHCSRYKSELLSAFTPKESVGWKKTGKAPGVTFHRHSVLRQAHVVGKLLLSKLSWKITVGFRRVITMSSKTSCF